MAYRNSKITAEVVKNFPKWSKAYVDPSSAVQSFLNPLSYTTEDIQQKNIELMSFSNIVLCDPEAEPYRAWVVEQSDILSGDTGIFEDGIDSAIGYISGQPVPIRIVARDEFITASPTAYVVAGTFPTSGNPDSVAYDELGLSLMMTYADSTEYLNQELPLRWGGSGQEDMFTATDPLLTETKIEKFITYSGETLLLDDKKIELFFSGDLATDVLAELADQVVTYPLQNIIEFIDTSTWSVSKYNDQIDYNGDGVIDQREVDEIASMIGKKRIDYTDEVWFTDYAKYDLDSNGLIDMNDYHYVVNSLNSCRTRGTLIRFKATGRWRFTLYGSADNLAVTSCFARTASGMGSIRGKTFGSLNKSIPTGCKWGVYHAYIGAYLVASATEHAVYMIKLQDDITIDKVKFPMPMRATNSTLRGIALFQDNLIVLRKDDLGFSLLLMNTKYDAIDKEITSVDIHSGIQTDRDVFLRDTAGLTDAYGLTFIGSTKLATVDQGAVKILTPLFDYVTIISNIVPNTMHFREKYDAIVTSPAHTFYPTYYYLFNQIDHFALNNGISRLPGEDNWSLKNRVLDVWRNFPDRSRNGIVAGIGRELGTDQYRKYNQSHIEEIPELSGDFTHMKIIIDDVVVSGEIMRDTLYAGKHAMGTKISATVEKDGITIATTIDPYRLTVDVRD